MESSPTDIAEDSGIRELDEIYGKLKQPFDRGEIVRFNLAYQRLYPRLTKCERIKAELLVDIVQSYRQLNPSRETAEH